MPPDGRFPSLDEGVSFAERYGGTNAIALSLRLHRPVRTEPQHHYCAFLSGWYLCALPLRLSTQTLCLAIVTERESITRLHLTLLGLLSQTVSHRYRESLLSRTPEHPPVRLSAQQRAVLLCLARGMTERAAAAQLHLCEDTVKYPKRNLFRIFSAPCSVSLVVKALQSGAFSLEEIGV